MQTSMFESSKQRPLAYELRPTSFDDYVGQKHLLANYPYLKGESLPSLVLWGPPGCGKTTLAHILADQFSLEFYPFNAVMSGVADLRKLIKAGVDSMKPFAIFIDEIHRFNKSQQDALLPHVEAGDFVLIGATTENPKVSVNRALLSRMQLVELKVLEREELVSLVHRGAEKLSYEIADEAAELIADYSSGDARKALNHTEAIAQARLTSVEQIKEMIKENSRHYDRAGDRHYDVISAFIKSMRGTDPDAALLWLAVMLEGGEDPVFIARRLVIFASEDIGNADPRALSLATDALTAVSNVGMPEARIILGQATSYLASTVKSNASYRAIDAAIAFVRDNPNIEVPTHLRNLHPDKKNYRYPHAYKNAYIDQVYAPMHPRFYEPKEYGQENFLKCRLESLKN